MKGQSNVTLLKQQFFCNMFSKIFLDHILNLRIHQFLDLFDFSGFASDLKPSLHGVGKINYLHQPSSNLHPPTPPTPRKHFNKKKNISHVFWKFQTNLKIALFVFE